jgi:hypothetical protein
MNCQADIQKLAESKLESAEILLQNGKQDEAYYLAGYTVELLLKARVCKTLRVDDFFVFNKAKKELYKPYKVHNLQELILLSGIYPEFVESQKDVGFKGHWSNVNLWSEESRYLTGKTLKEVNDFVTSIKEISKWIKGLL